MFSSVNLSLAAGKMCKNKLVTAASGTIIQNHRLLFVSILGVKIAALGSLNRVTGRISKKQLKFRVQFCHELKNKKKIKNYQRMHRKYPFIIISHKKTYSSRDSIPLKHCPTVSEEDMKGKTTRKYKN
jgi:hypothetical protein